MEKKLTAPINFLSENYAEAMENEIKMYESSVRIQKTFRGYFVRKEMNNFVPPSSPVSIMDVHKIVYFDNVSSEQEKRAKLTRKILKHNTRIEQRRIRGQRRIRAFHAYQ